MQNPITPAQKDKEDSDPLLKRCEDEHSKFQAIVQSSKSSLWSSLLTINGLFIAFTLNKSAWPCDVHFISTILFVIPALIVLWLFYIDKYSKTEFLKVYTLITEIVKENLRNTDTQIKAKEAGNKNKKAVHIKKIADTIGQTLEHIAMDITAISICWILVLQFLHY